MLPARRTLFAAEPVSFTAPIKRTRALEVQEPLDFKSHSTEPITLEQNSTC